MAGELLLFAVQEFASRLAGEAWEGFLRTRRFLQPAPRAALARAAEIAYDRTVIACLNDAAERRAAEHTFTTRAKSNLFGVRAEVELRMKKRNGGAEPREVSFQPLLLDQGLDDALAASHRVLMDRALSESPDGVYATIVREGFLDELRDQVLAAIAEEPQAQHEWFENLFSGIEARLRGLEPHLDLRVPSMQVGTDKSSNAVFTASVRLIDFERRAGEEDQLRAWLASPERFAGAFILGDGGAGKTRLALEVVREQLLDPLGYDAGFLGARALAAFVNHPNMARWRPERDTLLVIDYAAAHLQELQRLVPHLADACGRAGAGPRVRVLLLDRLGEDADARLRLIFATDAQVPRGPWTTLTLPRLVIADPAAWARSILQATIDRLQGLGVGPRVEIPPLTADDMAALADATEMRPLYLQLLAYQVCVQGSASGLRNWSRADLLRAAVERERAHILRKIPGASPEDAAARRAVTLAYALATLRRGVPPQDAPFFDAVARLAGAPHLGSAVLAEHLRRVNGVTREDGPEKLPPLEPDAVGSAFAALVLAEFNPAEALALALDAQPFPAWDRVRLMVDDVAPLEKFPGAGEWLEAHVARLGADETARLRAMLPDPSVSWVRWRRALAARWVVLITPAEGETRPERLAEHAGALNNLSVELAQEGKRGEALAFARRATEGYRALARIEADRFESDLAMSLNNYAAMLSDVGRREEAIIHAKESLDVRRKLAAANKDAYEPDLAKSLNNYANRLSDVGRREEALTHAKEGLDLYRKLAQANPDAYGPDLAKSLGSQGAILLHGHQPKEAARSFEEGLRTILRLLRLMPEAFAKLTAALLRGYLESCKAADAPPDERLVREVLTLLKY